MRYRSLSALLFVCVACVPPDSETLSVEEQEVLTPERVVRSARGGKVDLDLQFSEFFNRPFTLSTWFQPEFVRAYDGPILAASGGGRFSIGMGEYSHATSMLTLRIGPKTVDYRVPGLQRREWYHLAVTRSNFTYSTGLYTFSVYLDGQKLTPQRFDKIGGGPCLPVPCLPETTVIVDVSEIAFSSSDPMTQVPNGSVRIGRLSNSYDPLYWQFYGLVDEIAAYDGLASISTLAADRRVVETTALIKGFTFDSVIQTNPKLKHVATFTEPTKKVPYETSGTSIFDLPEYASPTEGTYRLPFAAGQAWKATQEFDDTTSHHGGSAFCWDFERVGVTTHDTPVYASADGDMVSISDNDEGYVPPDDWDNQPWKTKIRTAPDEATSYLHLRAHSVQQAVCPNDNCSPLPSETANFVSIDEGQQVGVVGTSRDPDNSHLHFGLRGLLGETHTIPMAFSNYDTCVLAAGEAVRSAADLAKCTWRRVARGMPRQGEIIRRP